MKSFSVKLKCLRFREVLLPVSSVAPTAVQIAAIYVAIHVLEMVAALPL